MKRFYLIGFALLLAFDTLNLFCFKLAGNGALPVEMSAAWLGRVFSHPWIYGAIIGYVGAFFTWMSLLKHAPIGPAFAASHLEVISVMLLSYWVFSEPVTVTQIIGAVAILLGIVCLAMSETDGGEHASVAESAAHVISP
ncbi:drug/metabolite transporter (DMT)-like permease [Luteibacter sp. Sphag1AF]|uniref:EamA family transporter n=1 Tax=Luteibacter sp. Sphag1AF TaxID=2587031 RepID=UPI0016190083|nr:EamA family transporter [Luteibacter sp. Sphag1AF]MBB3225786.1 drug/metabolite transporter (DMT)-like permease [Luteibacter sp. Sphag1AF]